VRDLRPILAVVVTAVVLGAGLLLSSRGARPVSSPAREAGPDAAVWALFEAQRKGDVARYLAQLTGDARRGAEQSLKETGRRAFQDYLRRRDAEIKGIGVKGREEQEDGSVTLLVDLVYTDGQEEHRFDVRREGGAWRIAAVSGGTRHPSLIPYGTPVVPLGKDEPPAEPSAGQSRP